MENFSYHVPVYVASGGVKLSGHSSELVGAQVGLFDRSTFSVATGAGSGKEFFFAQGSIGGKSWYGQPLTDSHKSPFFLGKDVENMYVSLPKRIQNEEWVIGFNGAASSKSLTFETGKATRIQLYFFGNPIYRFFAGPKTYVISYTPLEDCTEPCTGSDCPEGIADCLTHTQKLVDMINTHTELQKFGVRATIVNTPYVAGTTNMTKWELEVCDNGTSVDLQAVQAQVGTDVKVTRLARVGSTSVYGFCASDDADDPADFQQSGAVSLAICGECPAGSTATAGTDVYYVTRAITPSTDLSTGGAQQTYADTIGTAYEAASTATIPTTDVNTSTDTITETAHKFVTGQKVTYSNGGGASAGGLTTATDYYVIKTGANTFKVATTFANAVAGTAIDITSTGNNAQTFSAVFTAAFVGQTGATAQVKLTVPAGASVTTLLADSVDFAFSTGETCTFAAPAAIAWTEAGTGLSSERTMKISQVLREECDGGDRLADLTAILSGVQGIQIGTLTQIAGTACSDDYTVVQSSLDCLDEEACLSNSVTFTYDELPAFEGHPWEVVPPTVTENENRQCGIRISAGYIDPKFGNCSFSPMDYYETMPIKMEVSLLQEDGDRCDAANWPSVQQTKVGQIARQSGEYVLREVIMKTNAYLAHMKQYSDSPRMREAFDMNLLDLVDRNAFYKLYYVTYKASYGMYTWRKNEQEKFTTIFAFKEDDPQAAVFEASILDVLTAKSGVTLHVND